jgi:ribosomal protein L36
MKVRASVKVICKDCKVIKSKGVLELFVKAVQNINRDKVKKLAIGYYMARILGVDIPRNKAMRIALQSLYGVGPKVALDVLKLSGD